MTGVKWSWPQVSEAFKDPQLYFCCFNAFLSSVPNGGLSVFGSLMNQSFGFTNLQVLLMDIPRSVVSVIIFLIVGIYTRRVANRRMFIMAFATLPPLAGFLAMALLPDAPEYKWVKWGMYLMTVPFVLGLFLGWTLSQSLSFPPSLSPSPHHPAIFGMAPFCSILPPPMTNPPPHHQSRPTSPGAPKRPSSAAPPSSATARAT